MTLSTALIILLALAAIVGGIMVLKKSAKKFNLTEEQLEKIKKRNRELEQQEED